MPAIADPPAADTSPDLSAVDPESPRGKAIAAVRELKARDPAVAAVLGPGETDVLITGQEEDWANEPAVFAYVVVPSGLPPEQTTWDARFAAERVVMDVLRDLYPGRFPYVYARTRNSLDAPPERW